jgi:hypothetical protein
MQRALSLLFSLAAWGTCTSIANWLFVSVWGDGHPRLWLTLIIAECVLLPVVVYVLMVHAFAERGDD